MDNKHTRDAHFDRYLNSRTPEESLGLPVQDCKLRHVLGLCQANIRTHRPGVTLGQFNNTWTESEPKKPLVEYVYR